MDVLLLGNGFDLHYNLPTKYQNFLHVVDWLIKHYNEKITTIADVFGNAKLQEDDWYLSNCFKLYEKACGNVGLDSEKIRQIIEICKDNIWFKYLEQSYNKDVGWIDFEKEIGFVCSSFDKMLKYGHHHKVDISNILGISMEDLSISAEERSIVTEFFDFWIDRNDHYVAPDKKLITRYIVNQKYSINYPRGSACVDLNADELIKYLVMQLREFADCLKFYLQIFSDSLCDELIEKGLIQPLPIEGDEVVTLNYTKTYEKLYGEENVHHVHGCTLGPIVLGINSSEQDELGSVNTRFIHFKKYFQRVLYRTDLPYLNWLCHLDRITEQRKAMNVDSFVDLYVIGHSLDITDAEIIKELFGYANRITIFSHSDQATSEYIAHLIQIFGKEQFDMLRFQKTLIFTSYGEEGESIIQDHQREKMLMAMST